MKTKELTLEERSLAYWLREARKYTFTKNRYFNIWIGLCEIGFTIYVQTDSGIPDVYPYKTKNQKGKDLVYHKILNHKLDYIKFTNNDVKEIIKILDKNFDDKYKEVA